MGKRVYWAYKVYSPLHKGVIGMMGIKGKGPNPWIGLVFWQMS